MTEIHRHPDPPLIQSQHSVQQNSSLFYVRLVCKILAWLVTMGRRGRGRGACPKKGNKCSDQHSSNDRISMLPDDLLVFILSFLTLKEATTTCILSSRWRHLWTFILVLDFDTTKSLQKVELNKTVKALLNCERRKYIRWVDRVLASHQNSTIEKFRVVFDLSESSKKFIDKWLIYALARKVRRLELDFTGSRGCRRYDDVRYTFPHDELLRTDLSIHLEYLKRISLNFVNMNGEALEFLLCNCPLLEHLSISHSNKLTSLNIYGTFHSLRRLEISSCKNLKSLEICDSNLVYLKYIGSRIELFHLENVPRLVEIYIGDSLHMKDVILLLSSYLPQLEIFTIAKLEFSWEETVMFYSAVKMSNLKQLVVKTYIDEDCSLLPLSNLIRASPFLQRFVLEAEWMEPKFVKRKVEMVTMTCSYIHLKEVEFVGYYGRISDLELVMHFLENAIELEKIDVDPRYPSNYRLKSNDDVKEDMVARARARARRQLAKKVASRIKLNIL